MEPLDSGTLKPTKPFYAFGQFIEAVYLPVSRRRWKVSTTMTTEATFNAHLAPAFGPRLLAGIAGLDGSGGPES